MLLVVDVGNTHTTFGLFDRDRLSAERRILTNRDRTVDETAVSILGLLSLDRLSPKDVEGVALASVVPSVTAALREAATQLFGRPPIVVSSEMNLGIKLAVDRPSQVGADRIVNAIAAFKRHGAPAIAVDLGTATTFDCVSQDGRFLGGAITPGIGTLAAALPASTAILPKAELSAPDSAMGKNTLTAIQSGVFLGYVELVEGLVRRLRSEMDGQPIVVATGGFAEIVAPHCRSIDRCDRHLTLYGLLDFFERNRNETPRR